MALVSMAPLPIAGGFYRSWSAAITSQRCVNLYPVITKTMDMEKHSLFGTPGVTQVADTSTLNCRGAIEADGFPYFVFGDKLIRVDRSVSGSYTAVTVGTGIASTGPVAMAQNGSQIMVVAPRATGYIYTIETSTFAEITDGDFTASGSPLDVTFIDGYFAVATTQNKIVISNLNDGTAWDALDFGSAEADPDDIVALFVNRNGNRLYALGSETSQPFANIGGADFPFQSVQGGTLNVGCRARHSVVELGDTFLMVGGSENSSPQVFMFSGNGFVPVSNEGIDNLLSQLTEAQLSNIVGWSYSDKGAQFAGFTLADTTIVFDYKTGLWHERRTRYSDSLGNRQESVWRGKFLVRAYNRVLVGDDFGLIGEVSDEVYDEYGEEVLRYAVTQPFENQGNSFRVPRIEAVMEAGVGNAVENDPQVRLSFSRDGLTFGPERSRAMGAIGKRQKRQIWKKNGRFSDTAVVRLSFSDKAKFALSELRAQFA